MGLVFQKSWGRTNLSCVGSANMRKVAPPQNVLATIRPRFQATVLEKSSDLGWPVMVLPIDVGSERILAPGKPGRGSAATKRLGRNDESGFEEWWRFGEAEDGAGAPT